MLTFMFYSYIVYFILLNIGTRSNTSVLFQMTISLSTETLDLIVPVLSLYTLYLRKVLSSCRTLFRVLVLFLPRSRRVCSSSLLSYVETSRPVFCSQITPS